MTARYWLPWLRCTVSACAVVTDASRDSGSSEEEALVTEVPTAPEPEATPEVPAAERIAKLFAEMIRQKALLVAVIDFCRDERTAAQIDEMLAPLQEFRRSVYTPSTIRRLLERAGALDYFSHDEAPEEQVDENGNLVVPEKPDPTWLSTADGLEYIEAQDPFSELVRAIEPYAEHIEVFRRILEACNEEGTSISAIERGVAELGILAGGKLQAGFFVGKLEDFEAIEWRGSWITTELGLQYLEYLAQNE